MTANLEYLHELAREAEDKADQLGGITNRILDIPVKGPRGGTNIQNELLEAGYFEPGTGSRRIIDQRDAVRRKLNELQAEIEVLTSIADDLIGKTGRLV